MSGDVEACRVVVSPVPYPSDAVLLSAMQDEMRCYREGVGSSWVQGVSVLPAGLLLGIVGKWAVDGLSSRRARARRRVTQ